jgi:hypothetical protein
MGREIRGAPRNPVENDPSSELGHLHFRQSRRRNEEGPRPNETFSCSSSIGHRTYLSLRLGPSPLHCSPSFEGTLSSRRPWELVEVSSRRRQKGTIR